MAGSAFTVDTIRPLQDPNEGQNGEGEGRPVNEGVALMIEDGPQSPRDDESARKVSIDRRECVGSCGSFQEEKGEEYKDLSPDPRVMVLGRIDAKCLKGGQEDKNSGPPMPHGEWQVHKQLIARRLGGMVLLDDVVDVANCGGDQEGENEGGDIMMMGPYGDEDRV